MPPPSDQRVKEGEELEADKVVYARPRSDMAARCGRLILCGAGHATSAAWASKARSPHGGVSRRAERWPLLKLPPP